MKNNEIVFDRERKRHIHELKKQKKYDEIFELYGQKIYNSRLGAPKKYRKKEIKRFVKEGRFDELYRKYGKKKYKKYAHIEKQRQIEKETGSKIKGLNYRFKRFLKRKFLPFFASSSLILSGGTAALFESTVENMKEENAIEYSEEIEKYNEKVEKYINEEIEGKDYSDLQIIMKVMNDMWENIEGYGNPTIDPLGYNRIAFSEDNGVGVCRNMADHMTYVLNEINPGYNARNFTVTLDEDGVKLADIERKKAEVENEENNQEENNELWKKFFGNHMVTAVDIPEKNLTLIVDSTNPSIGVFANGEIDMFWNKSGDGIELAFLGNALQNGKFGISETFEEIAKSFLKTKYSKDELIAEYGLEAQNAALQFIKEEDTKQIQENKEKSKVLISDYSNSSQMNKNVSNTVNTRPNIREDEER